MSQDMSSPPPLGDLELAVLEFIWSQPDVSPKQVHARLGTHRGISLNTVQSTLERLFRKQLLARNKRGHAYHYRARVAREALVASLIGDVLQRFHADGPLSVAAFASAAESLDDTLLAQLEAEIRARREQGGDA